MTRRPSGRAALRESTARVAAAEAGAIVSGTLPAGTLLHKRNRGFTLLEVLVALGIFATVAVVVLTAAGRSLNNAARLEEKTLAGWIADNRLTQLQLARPSAGLGAETQALEYAGRHWETFSEIEPSSDPSLRRVNVWVALRPERADRASVRERATLSLTGFVPVRQ
jgi:general secretion pathway protein I